jgi:transcriptional regulator with XRE-family HTH domain
MDNTQEKNEIAKRILQLLKWKDISQNKLATGVGISRSHLNMCLSSKKTEKGTMKGFSDEILKRIANYFEVDYNYLKSGNDLILISQKNLSTLINTNEAFELKCFQTEEEILYSEQQMEEFESNLKEHFIKRIIRMNERDLNYLYYFWDAVISIDNTQFLFLNYITQLNSIGMEKLSRFMNSMMISHEDIVKRLPSAFNLYKSESLFDEAKKVELSREEIIKIIENQIIDLSDDKIRFLFYHIDNLLSLTKSDYKTLKRFVLLGNSVMTFSAIGYKIPTNYEIIFDFIEAILLDTKHIKKIDTNGYFSETK